MSDTILSIILPTYNRAKCLDISLSTYIVDKRHDLEIIVCDNNSLDETEEVVKKYISIDSRIKYIKNPYNVGFTRNLFRGWMEIKSPWWMVLCDDDIGTSGFIDQTIQHIHQYPESGVIYTVQATVKNGCLRYHLPKRNQTTYLKPGGEAISLMLNSADFVPGTVFSSKLVKNDYWKLDSAIYPHLRIATSIASKAPVLYVIGSEYIVAGGAINRNIQVRSELSKVVQPNEDSNSTDFGYISRPKDFEIIELFSLAEEIVLKEQDFKIVESFLLGLTVWCFDTFVNLLYEDKSIGLQFLESISSHEYIFKNISFWKRCWGHVSKSRDSHLITRFIELSSVIQF